MAENESESSMDYSYSTEHMNKLGLFPGNWTNHVIVAEALARGLNVGATEKGYITLDRGRRQFTWKSGYTNFNTLLAQRVALYKDVYSRLLLDYGAMGTENAVFKRGEAERAFSWGEPLGELVVKPVDGIHGRHVFVELSSRYDFISAFNKVAEAGDGRVLVEKFYRGTEHRCLLVNHKLIAVTRRRPASVLGDGVSSIQELIAEKNRNRVRGVSKVHSEIVLDESAVQLLAENSLAPDSVPSLNQRVYLRKVSNIHAGGDAVDATSELSSEEIAAVEHAARAVPGGRVVGLDVLLPRNPGEDDMRVLEMNTNSMISIHHFPWEGEPRDVAGAVLDALFPGSGKSEESY